jgi:hypothetical protein
MTSSNKGNKTSLVTRPIPAPTSKALNLVFRGWGAGVSGDTKVCKDGRRDRMNKREERDSMWGTGYSLVDTQISRLVGPGRTPSPKPPRTPSTLASIPFQYSTPFS